MEIFIVYLRSKTKIDKNVEARLQSTLPIMSQKGELVKQEIDTADAVLVTIPLGCLKETDEKKPNQKGIQRFNKYCR